MKYQKPIDYDIHLKYLCNKCGSVHWLSFKEASTDQFKVVCDCDNIFTVRRVSGFKLKYFDQQNKSKINEEKPQTSSDISKQIPEFLLTQTIKALIPYGFTSAEAKELIVKSYNEQPNDNPLLLVKQTLASLRSTNV